MLMSKASGGTKQATIIEVNASAKPSEVVSAVLRGADAPRSSMAAGNRMMQGAFAFVIVFAMIVYFRQEIWSMSRDVSKHPIMGYTEQLQIRHYLGTQWLFGTGKDITSEDVEVARLSKETAALEQASNITTEADTTKPAAGTTTTAAAAAGASNGTATEAAGSQGGKATDTTTTELGALTPGAAKGADGKAGEGKTAAGQTAAGGETARPASKRQQRKLLRWGRKAGAAVRRVL